MKFTDKFIEVPFLTYDGKSQQITNAELKDVEMMEQIRKIYVTQIEAYDEAIPANKSFAAENLTSTEVYMRSGNGYVINLSLKDFEEVLNKFYHQRTLQ